MRFGYWETRVHGLSAADVEDAPEFPDVIAEFLPDFNGGLLLAHNASFDMAVLRATSAAYGLAPPSANYLCSVQVAKRTWPEERSHKLNVLASRLNLNFQHHHASEDALVCARVVLAAASELGAASMTELVGKLTLAVNRLDHAGAAVARSGRPTRRERAPKIVTLNGLSFTVRGSSGNRYTISETSSADGFDLSCECIGWKTGRRCRHVHAILLGDIDDLETEGPDAFALLRARLDAHGMPEQYRDWTPSPRKLAKQGIASPIRTRASWTRD